MKYMTAQHCTQLTLGRRKDTLGEFKGERADEREGKRTARQR